MVAASSPISIRFKVLLWVRKNRAVNATITKMAGTFDHVAEAVLPMIQKVMFCNACALLAK